MPSPTGNHPGPLAQGPKIATGIAPFAMSIRPTGIAYFHPRTRYTFVAPRLREPCSRRDRKSTRLNSSHLVISYAVFCLKKKKNNLTNSVHTTQYHTFLLQKNYTLRCLSFVAKTKMMW